MSANLFLLRMPIGGDRPVAVNLILSVEGATDASIMVTTAPETGAKYMRYYQSSRTVFIFSCFVLFHIIIIILKIARIQKKIPLHQLLTPSRHFRWFLFFKCVLLIFSPAAALLSKTAMLACVLPEFEECQSHPNPRCTGHFSWRLAAQRQQR